MLNFGMEHSYRTPDKLYMRGTGKRCCINAGNMPSQSPPPFTSSHTIKALVSWSAALAALVRRTASR
jgi:hypothetical protein